MAAIIQSIGRRLCRWWRSIIGAVTAEDKREAGCATDTATGQTDRVTINPQQRIHLLCDGTVGLIMTSESRERVKGSVLESLEEVSVTEA